MEGQVVNKDDLMVLCKQAIEEFSSCSGLQPNLKMSTMFCGNIKSRVKKEIKRLQYSSFQKLWSRKLREFLREFYGAKFVYNLIDNDKEDKLVWSDNRKRDVKFSVHTVWNDFRGEGSKVECVTPPKWVVAEYGLGNVTS
ncbi:hypothetical protein Tco_0772098 [Tanacetum coccineum]|uniref:Myb/SANT-like domain-containing protein n=1 Tax=Tanacetum coccineum TaxID=301880 RepID=A0ABQ4ZI15_9ASTR